MLMGRRKLAEKAKRQGLRAAGRFNAQLMGFLYLD